MNSQPLILLLLFRSIVLLIPPSIESTLKNTVTIIPRIHITLDFKNLDSLPICTLSDKLETIPIVVATIVNGSINKFITLPIITMLKIIMGCTIDTEIVLPRCTH